jgi:hypothetical protein
MTNDSQISVELKKEKDHSSREQRYFLRIRPPYTSDDQAY